MRGEAVQATFRFYAELNDHLPRERRGVTFTHRFEGAPAIKDVIEGLGVPHPEIDLILIDGRPVGFDETLRDGARVAVYPVFEAIDIAPIARLRPEPLREPRFIADVHLAALARLLRFAGFDVHFSPDADDAEIAERSVRERRIVLTRDRGLLDRKAVTHGYWLRSGAPEQQLVEVIRRFDLTRRMRPFSRCAVCNTPLEPASPEQIADRVPPRIARTRREFRRCPGCERVYWAGSHQQRIAERLAQAARAGEQPDRSAR